MYYVSAFCQRALWLRSGRVEALGPARDVVREYESFLLAKSAQSLAPHDAPLGLARITGVRQIGREGESGQYPSHYPPHAPFVLEVDWECEDPERAFISRSASTGSTTSRCCRSAPARHGLAPAAGRRRYRARLEVPELPLLKGSFTVYVFLLDESALHVFDRRILRGALVIDNPEFVAGLLRTEHRWQVEGLQAAVEEPPLLLSAKRSR